MKGAGETLLSLASFGIWLQLALGRWNFWKADQRLPDVTPELRSWPPVVAVIPARNEVAVIRRTLASVANQDYPGPFSIILADDNSTDGTGRAALEVAADEILDVIKVPPLAEEWTGKLWALSHGIDHAHKAMPDHKYVWLTDADIVHSPNVLRRLVAKTEEEGRSMVSLMVKLRTDSFWESLFIPAFVFFFQMLYPFPAINRDLGGKSGAAGGCILVSREALDNIGGIGAIRGALIDDCALATKVRETGGRLWLGLTDASRSIRSYAFRDLWQMVTRTAYTQLRYSIVRIVGTVIGMGLMFVAPVVLVVTFPLHEAVLALWFGAASWFLMGILYAPTLGLYGQSLLHALFLPVTAVLYTLMTIDSAIRHWLGKGGAWKGRTY